MIESASPVISMAMVAETESITVFARALAQVFTPGGCYTIMPFHKRFSVEPYGIFWLKDRPLSPGARTVLSALRAASERKMRRLAEPGADTENHIGLANNHI